MAIEVAKVELKTVKDASGLEACIANGQFAADEIVAVIGKTEGNGGVNDFTRILADEAFRRVLMKHGTRGEGDVANIPMVWSGGCDGVITPHATVFAANGKTGPQSKSRLTIGTAMSVEGCRARCDAEGMAGAHVGRKGFLQLGDFGGTLLRPVVAEQSLGAQDLQYGILLFLIDDHSAGVHRREWLGPGRSSALDGQLGARIMML